MITIKIILTNSKEYARPRLSITNPIKQHNSDHKNQGIEGLLGMSHVQPEIFEKWHFNETYMKSDIRDSVDLLNRYDRNATENAIIATFHAATLC